MKTPKKNIEAYNATAKSSKESIWKKDIYLWPKKNDKSWSLKKKEYKNLNVATPKDTQPKTPKPIKKSKPVKEKKENIPRYKIIIFTTAKVLIFSLLAILLLSTSAVYAYKSQYEDKAFYGTKILGEDVGGKTQQEIQKILERKISEVSFMFSVDNQNVVVKPEELGVVFDISNTTGTALKTSKAGAWYEPYLHSASSLIYKIYPPLAENLDPTLKNNLYIAYNFNDQKLADFTQNLSAKFNIDSKNAGLVMQGTDVQVIPAVSGRKIISDSVKNQIADALKNGKSSNIQIDVEKVNPAILENDTKEAIVAAKNIISQSVVYHYKGQNFVPDKTTVAGWIVFNTKDSNGTQKLIPAVDPNRAYSYIYSLASKINVPAVNKKITIKNGSEQVVEQEGKDGLAVDVDSATSTTANYLSSARPVDLELPTYAVKPKTQVNNIIVADWSKYIEVNLSTQRMTAYTAGGVVVNTWAITSGAVNKGYATPTGTFLILSKAGEGGVPGSYGGGVCMPNPPSSTPLCGINYVSYFTGQGHAIHEAWWRSSFGGGDYVWNGSHGCINATYDLAKYIFYWAPIGTPVIVHY